MTNDVKLTEARIEEIRRMWRGELFGNPSGDEVDALAALARLGRAYQWQDISSAPKDGTPILISESRGIFTAYWSEGHEFWVGIVTYLRPTHWLPLPPPPTEESVVSDVSRREGLNCEPSGKGESQSRHGSKPPLPSVGREWRHLKTGGIYQVLDSDIIIEATMKRGIIYQGHDGKKWLRPYAEFHDGRFERVTDTKGEEDGRRSIAGVALDSGLGRNNVDSGGARASVDVLPLTSPEIGELAERLHNADAGNYDIVCEEAAAALERMEKERSQMGVWCEGKRSQVKGLQEACAEYQSIIAALCAEKGRLNDAAKALIDDVRSRYPDEGLRCPHMIELASVADVCVPFDRGPDFDGLWCQTHKRYWSDCSIEEKVDD